MLLGWKDSTIFCATGVHEGVLRPMHPHRLGVANEWNGTFIFLMLLGHLIPKGAGGATVYMKTYDYMPHPAILVTDN